MINQYALKTSLTSNTLGLTVVLQTVHATVQWTAAQIPFIRMPHTKNIAKVFTVLNCNTAKLFHNGLLGTNLKGQLHLTSVVSKLGDERLTTFMSGVQYIQCTTKSSCVFCYY